LLQLPPKCHVIRCNIQNDPDDSFFSGKMQKQKNALLYLLKNMPAPYRPDTVSAAATLPTVKPKQRTSPLVKTLLAIIGLSAIGNGWPIVYERGIELGIFPKPSLDEQCSAAKNKHSKQEEGSLDEIFARSKMISICYEAEKAALERGK
jgi:hypothetical protein